MPLPQAPTRIPESIADLSVVLTDYIEDQNKTEVGSPIFQTGRFEVQVKYTNGEIRNIKGDLVPHLTAGQITALMGFMDFLRNKAEQEILP